MLSGRTLLLLWLSLSPVLSSSPVLSDEPRKQSDSEDLQTFRRPTLLGRFDRDGDGELNVAERSALCRAFAGQEAPMLPATAYPYVQPPSPAYLSASALAQMDNTPADNPLTNQGAELGRVLFYDKQLSRNNATACASCHLQRKAFSDPERFSIGFQGGRTGRNAMGLANLRYSILRGSRPGFFWDERAATLEAQVLMPIQDPVEMGMDLASLEKKLRRLPYYPPLFRAAFGSADITSQGVSKAVAQFMRSMISFDSRFDRAARGNAGGDLSKDFDDFTQQENLGKALFINGVAGVAEIGCAHCHIPPTFGMPKAFNNGLELHYKDRGLGAREAPSNDVFTPSNDGKFKAPPLRNIALTAPYMHDGRFQTLEEVVEHYSSGVQPHVNLGLAFREEASAAGEGTAGFRLTPPQQAALVAFLKTLTDDAFVSDPRFSDPFVHPTD